MGYFTNAGMRHPNTVAEEIDAAHAETEEIQKLSEEEVCRRYNVDSREEIIRMIREDIYWLRGEYEAAARWQAEQEGRDFEEWLKDYSLYGYIA
jgi:hypothetical protein